MTQRAARAQLRSHLEELLRVNPAARAAILFDSRRADDGAAVIELAETYPNVHLVIVDLAERPGRVWGLLAAAGPLNLLIDATGDEGGEVARFSAYFQQLTHDGCYVLPEYRSRWAASRRPRPLLVELGESRDTAVDDVAETPGSLRVRRRGRNLVKMREAEINVALAADPKRGEIVATMPGATVESSVVLTSNQPLPPEYANLLKPSYVAPELFLRGYNDVVCAPQSIVIQGNLLLPDTYRHHQYSVLRHKRLKSAGPGYAKPEPDLSASLRDLTRLPVLEGTFFHLDNEFRGHFGHALTEQISRLWAWEQAKAEQPELKVLVGKRGQHEYADWERILLGAAGVSPGDVVIIDGPVRVERLLAGTPMFHQPEYVHPRIVDVWDRIGTTLRAEVPNTSRPSRIFCSRRHRRRACTNREEVEALFAEFGFAVIYPEDFSLPEQLDIFHQAEVVAGFSGSQLFTSMFSDRPKHTILIGPSSYTATNEYLIGVLRQHRIDIVSCETEVKPPPAGSWRREAFVAPFEFNLAREGVWLRSVLESL